MSDTKGKSRETVEEKAFNLHHHVTTASQDHQKYVYNVPSSGEGDSYNVTQWQDPEVGENQWICECVGFRYNGYKSLAWHCSHIKAVHLALDNGIITHTHSIKDPTIMANAKIREARLEGQFESKIMEDLLCLNEHNAGNTDIVITMRVRANDFKLSETTFSYLNGLNGTVVINPCEAQIDVQLKAAILHDAPIPEELPLERELMPTIVSMKRH